MSNYRHYYYIVSGHSLYIMSSFQGIMTHRTMMGVLKHPLVHHPILPFYLNNAMGIRYLFCNLYYLFMFGYLGEGM